MVGRRAHTDVQANRADSHLIDDDADAAEIRSICCCDRTRCSHRRSVTTHAALGLLTFGACRGLVSLM